MDRCLDIAPVEVDTSHTIVLILQITWVRKRIRLNRAHVVDGVDVEARIGLVRSSVYEVPHIAAIALVVELSIQPWLHSSWREYHVFIDEVGVAARFMGGCQLIHECLVEVKELRVLLDVWNGWNCLSDVFVLSYDGIVHQRSREVEALLVVLVQHGGGDVWNVASRVGLSSYVYFEVLDGEDVQKVLEERNKVVGRLLFTSGCYIASGKAETNWIFDPSVFIRFGTF